MEGAEVALILRPRGKLRPRGRIVSANVNLACPRRRETLMSRTPRTALPRLSCRWPFGLAAGLALTLAPVAAHAQSQMPETHTVKTGDTLWDLAKQYLKDPFLWPEIYRLNTLVVEDPHWIYPGEVLRLAASEKATAVPQTDSAAAMTDTAVAAAPADTGATQAGAEATADTMARAVETAPVAEALPVTQASSEAEPSERGGLFPPARGQMRIALTAGELPQRSTLRVTDFYSSGFLSEGQELPFGRLVGPVFPLQIPTRDPRGNATVFSRVAVLPPAGATYQVGDSLLVVDATQQLQGYGRIVQPRGMARVVAISEGTAIAEVVAVYGEIVPDLSVLPAEKFTDPGSARPQAVSDGVQASVIGWPGHRELRGSPGVVMFLDKGKHDGVSPGDVFEIRREAGMHRDGMITVNDVMATVQVVHVRERTSTIRVTGVGSPDVPRGTHAFQIAKLPS
jgi:LysM repeat protein